MNSYRRGLRNGVLVNTKLFILEKVNLGPHINCWSNLVKRFKNLYYLVRVVTLSRNSWLSRLFTHRHYHHSDSLGRISWPLFSFFLFFIEDTVSFKFGGICVVGIRGWLGIILFFLLFFFIFSCYRLSSVLVRFGCFSLF